MKSWNLTKTKQCAKCPWRVDADPEEIDNYNPDLHQSLEETIATPGALTNDGNLRVSNPGLKTRGFGLTT
jgi:hypothetical protein